VTSGFLVAGALRLMLYRELPASQWFNLAWWGFRTFMTFEKEAPAPPAPPPSKRRAPLESMTLTVDG
jgi:hypothetical protein